MTSDQKVLHIERPHEIIAYLDKYNGRISVVDITGSGEPINFIDRKAFDTALALLDEMVEALEEAILLREHHEIKESMCNVMSLCFKEVLAKAKAFKEGLR